MFTALREWLACPWFFGRCPVTERKDALGRIERKLDDLVTLGRIEKKLDLLLQDRIDQGALADVSRRIGRVTRKLRHAVFAASGALTGEFDFDPVVTEEVTMSGEMDHAVERVRNLETVGDGAVTLLGTLAGQIRATAGDKTAANALADEVDAKATAWADAIKANTPAEGEGGGAGPTTPSAAKKK